MSDTRPLSSIIVGDRHRKDFGDLPALARSIDEKGLLQPIAVTPANVLIAGERRLRAWPLSKFRKDEIPVHIVDLEEIIRGEWAENADRKDFTLTEVVAIEAAIASLVATPVGRPSKEISENGANLPKGKTSDKVAAFTGISGRTLEKAKAVVKAAEADPEKFGKLAADMDKTGRANGPYNRLRVIQQTTEIRKEPPGLPGRGPYRTIVADFPWPSEDDDEAPADRGRGYYGYPTMSIAEGCKMSVKGIAHEDATLWFWTTNFHLLKGHATTIIRAWGFEPMTMLTWNKDKMGRGQRLRGQTEHCIMAVRGKPTINLTNQTTRLDAKSREDSRKPDEFYVLVEELCPAPRYAELFARRTLPENWDGHGDQVGKFVDHSVDVTEKVDPETGEIIEEESQAKASTDASAPEEGKPESGDSTLIGPADVDGASRLADGRTSAATSEIMDVTSAASEQAATDLYAQAVEISYANKKASTSLVQRKLRINYNTANDLLERMEANGLVSARNHAGLRQIYLDKFPTEQSDFRDDAVRPVADLRNEGGSHVDHETSPAALEEEAAGAGKGATDSAPVRDSDSQHGEEDSVRTERYGHNDHTLPRGGPGPVDDGGVPPAVAGVEVQHENLPLKHGLEVRTVGAGAGIAPAPVPPIPDDLLRVELTKPQLAMLSRIRLEDCDRDEQAFIALTRKHPEATTAASRTRLIAIAEFQGLTSEQQL